MQHIETIVEMSVENLNHSILKVSWNAPTEFFSLASLSWLHFINGCDLNFSHIANLLQFLEEVFHYIDGFNTQQYNVLTSYQTPSLDMQAKV